MFGEPSDASTLHAAALREGLVALIRHEDWRPSKLAGPEWERARAWRAQEVSDNEIGRRLGVAGPLVGRRLGPRPGPAGDLAPQQDAPCGAPVQRGRGLRGSRSRALRRAPDPGSARG